MLCNTYVSYLLYVIFNLSYLYMLNQGNFNSYGALKRPGKIRLECLKLWTHFIWWKLQLSHILWSLSESEKIFCPYTEQWVELYFLKNKCFVIYWLLLCMIVYCNNVTNKTIMHNSSNMSPGESRLTHWQTCSPWGSGKSLCNLEKVKLSILVWVVWNIMHDLMCRDTHSEVVPSF
jgi:hypothetical protein